MKTQKQFVVLFLIAYTLFIFQQNLNAQVKYLKGYVVLISGDTVNGEIRNNPSIEYENYRKIRFREAKGKKIMSYTPTTIKSFKLDNSIFISRNFEDEEVFIKCVLTGTFNLYEAQVEVMQNTGIVLEKSYLFENAQEKILIEINDRKFKKQMSELFSDNQEIVQKIEDKAFTYKNVVDLFDAYNN